MRTPIGDYALLADLHTGPLVSRNGSIDWLCLPRFDSAAVFTSLLGNEEHGRWLMAPPEGEVVSREYEQGTFVLRTTWRTSTGEADVVEFMPTANDRADVVRMVRCTSGTVRIEHDLRLRPGYGAAIPWVRHVDSAHGRCLKAIAGPDAYILRGPLLHAGERQHTGTFDLEAGESRSWVLT